MIFTLASIIFDAMTDHSSVTANYRFSSVVNLVCSDIMVETSVSLTMYTLLQMQIFLIPRLYVRSSSFISLQQVTFMFH